MFYNDISLKRLVLPTTMSSISNGVFNGVGGNAQSEAEIVLQNDQLLKSLTSTSAGGGLLTQFKTVSIDYAYILETTRSWNFANYTYLYENYTTVLKDYCYVTLQPKQA